MTPLRRMLLAVLGWQSAGADPERLREHVKRLSGEFAPRSWDRPDNLDRAAGYIRAEFQRSFAKVTDNSKP